MRSTNTGGPTLSGRRARDRLEPTQQPLAPSRLSGGRRTLQVDVGHGTGARCAARRLGRPQVAPEAPRAGNKRELEPG